MYESGNASIAARRGRLLDGPSLRRLVEAGSAAELLVLLERAEDWRPLVGEVAPLAADPQSPFEVSVERPRSARLGALPRWYAPPARGLVEALVLPLDAQRVVALLRRRRAGETPEAGGAPIVGGGPPGSAPRHWPAGPGSPRPGLATRWASARSPGTWPPWRPRPSGCARSWRGSPRAGAASSSARTWPRGGAGAAPPA